MSLLLRDPSRLAKRLPAVVEQLPPELHPSALREFAGICEEEGFDADRVLARYRERPEGELLFARAFADEEEPGTRSQVERHLETSLSRLRERVLEAGTVDLRDRIRARVEELTRLLAEPDVPEATLQEYYRELSELHAALAAREAERRVRLPSGFGRGRRRGG